MATPSIRSSGSHDGGARSFVIGYPNTYSTGDICVLVVATCNQPISTPTDRAWTSLGSLGMGTGGAAGAISIQIWYHVITASGLPPTATIPDSGDCTAAFSFVLQDVDTSDPFPDVQSDSITSATLWDMPSVTTERSNSIVLYILGIDADADDAGPVDNLYLQSSTLDSLSTVSAETYRDGDSAGFGVVLGSGPGEGVVGQPQFRITYTSNNGVFFGIVVQGEAESQTLEASASDSISITDTTEIYDPGAASISEAISILGTSTGATLFGGPASDILSITDSQLWAPPVEYLGYEHIATSTIDGGSQTITIPATTQLVVACISVDLTIFASTQLEKYKLTAGGRDFWHEDMYGDSDKRYAVVKLLYAPTTGSQTFTWDEDDDNPLTSLVQGGVFITLVYYTNVDLKDPIKAIGKSSGSHLAVTKSLVSSDPGDAVLAFTSNDYSSSANIDSNYDVVERVNTDADPIGSLVMQMLGTKEDADTTQVEFNSINGVMILMSFNRAYYTPWYFEEVLETSVLVDATEVPLMTEGYKNERIENYDESIVGKPPTLLDTYQYYMPLYTTISDSVTVTVPTGTRFALLHFIVESYTDIPADLYNNVGNFTLDGDSFTKIAWFADSWECWAMLATPTEGEITVAFDLSDWSSVTAKMYGFNLLFYKDVDITDPIQVCKAAEVGGDTEPYEQGVETPANLRTIDFDLIDNSDHPCLALINFMHLSSYDAPILNLPTYEGIQFVGSLLCRAEALSPSLFDSYYFHKYTRISRCILSSIRSTWIFAMTIKGIEGSDVTEVEAASSDTILVSTLWNAGRYYASMSDSIIIGEFYTGQRIVGLQILAREAYTTYNILLEPDRLGFLYDIDARLVSDVGIDYTLSSFVVSDSELLFGVSIANDVSLEYNILESELVSDFSIVYNINIYADADTSINYNILQYNVIFNDINIRYSLFDSTLGYEQIQYLND